MRLFYTNKLFFYLIYYIFVTCTNSLECTHFNSNMGATFDLTDLVRKNDEPSYSVEDGDLPCTTYVEKNYTYIFNVCGTVALGIPSVCKTISGISTAGALQIDKRIESDPNDDYCYIVGAYSDATSKVELIDQNDPTKGLSITYYGDYCHNPVEQRRFVVDLVCDDRLNPSPSHAYEIKHCMYKATIPSVYGCPLECPVSNRHLCGGNGHCHYDTDKASARCFCNKGYSGLDCMTKAATDSLNYSPALLGLIITLFIIVILLIASIVLMIKQMAALKDDIMNYQVLKGGDENENTASL